MDNKTKDYVVIESLLSKEMVKRKIKTLFLELEKNDINITDFDSYKALIKMLDEMDEYNKKLLEGYNS